MSYLLHSVNNVTTNKTKIRYSSRQYSSNTVDTRQSVNIETTPLVANQGPFTVWTFIVERIKVDQIPHDNTPHARFKINKGR